MTTTSISSFISSWHRPPSEAVTRSLDSFVRRVSPGLPDSQKKDAEIFLSNVEAIYERNCLFSSASFHKEINTLATKMSARNIRVLLGEAEAMVISEAPRFGEELQEAIQKHMGPYGVRQIQTRLNWLKVGAVAASAYLCPASLAIGWKAIAAVGALACVSDDILMSADSSLLHKAVLSDDSEKIRQLIEDQFPQVVDSNGNTPLYLAINLRRLESLKLFLPGCRFTELQKALAFAQSTQNVKAIDIIQKEIVSRRNQSIVREWQVDGKIVRLFQIESKQLQYEIVDTNGRSLVEDFPIPEGLTIQACIDNICNQRPAFTPNGDLYFTSNCKSYFDSNTTINNQNWAVTLAVVGRVRTYNPSTWGGHAVILIEKVISARKTVMMGHLISTCQGKAEFVEVSESLKLKGRIGTFVKTREEVEKLISAIEADVKRESIPFDLRGSDAYPCRTLIDLKIFKLYLFGPMARRLGLLGANEEVDAPDNCMTWARKKLRLIGIHIPAIPASTVVRPIDYIRK